MIAGLDDSALKAFEARLIGPNGPFELELQPDGTKRYRNGTNSLGELYARARRMGERPLVVTEAGTTTYGAIFTQAAKLARRLHRDGRAGQRIALLLDDGPDWLTWFIAITESGASCLLPPPGANAQLAENCVVTAGCVAIVTAADRPGLAAISNLHDLTGDEDGDLPTNLPEAEALVAFTSGSSGEPKGVIHTHRSLLSGLRNMMLAGTLSSQMLSAPAMSIRPGIPANLVLAPLAYIAGYSAFLLVVGSGGRIVLGSPAAEAERIAGIVECQSIQSVVGASTELLRQLIRLPLATSQLASLRRAQLHGEGLQRGLIEEIETVLPELRIMTGFGLTETAGSIAAAPASSLIGIPGGCGRVLPSVDLRVIGPDGWPVTQDEIGQVQVRGQMLMGGYLDPARSAEAFTADGWYKTGDKGSVNAFGWLSIIGRDEGRNDKFTAEAEAAIRALPGIDDAVLASSMDGRTRMAFLQERAHSKVDRAQVAATLRALTGWAGEVKIRSLDRLPRTASGKVDKEKLVRSIA